MHPIRKLRPPWAARKMSERFMVGGFDRRNLTRRVLAQIVQEVGRVIPAYAFHDLGEHKPGLADRDTADRGASCKIIWNASHNPFQIEAMYLESIRRFSRQYSKIFRFTVRNYFSIVSILSS